MIEGGRLKLRLGSELERRLRKLAALWGVTPEQAIREMIAAEWEEEPSIIPAQTSLPKTESPHLPR